MDADGAEGSDFDYWLLDGEAARPLPGLCIICLLPHLVWVAATANVHSALSETNEGERRSRSTTTSAGATGGLPF